MDEAILQLRAGGLTDLGAIMLFVIFINWLEVSGKFTTAYVSYWLDTKFLESTKTWSFKFIFEASSLQMQKPSLIPQPEYEGMSYDEASNLIKETYSGSMQITEDCKITDWQSAKKAYHFQKGFGVDLDKYENMSKEDLVTLQNTEQNTEQNTDGGLIPYVQKAYRIY